MRALVIYESLTGNTKRAALAIVGALRASGAEAKACPITAIDYGALSAADLVLVGTWTDGMILVGQRPGRAGRIRKLPVMNGKRAAGFCTYAVDPGHAVDKLLNLLEDRGADVIGGIAIRRNDIEGGVRRFIDGLLQAGVA